MLQLAMRFWLEIRLGSLERQEIKKMADRSAFGAKTTADEVLDGIDLTGKTVLITGGTSGLGAETSRALAAKGAEVTITARTEAKGLAMVDQIKASTGKTISVEALELGSAKSIRVLRSASIPIIVRLTC